MNYSWSNIFNASLTELEAMISCQTNNTDQYIYMCVLISYLKNDFTSLAELMKDNANLLNVNLKSMIILRNSIKIKTFTDDDLVEFENEYISQISGIWRGEFYFSLAFAWTLKGNHEKALRYFYNSFALFIEEGVHRKALKAYLNAISAHENLNPKHLSLATFFYFIKVSKKVNALDAIGMANLNISYQYQRLGCILTSLKYAYTALEYFAEEKTSNHYFICTSQILDLLCSINTKDKKIPIISSEIQKSTLPEIQEVYKYLLRRYPKTLSGSGEYSENKKINIELLPLAWKIRLKNYSYGNKKYSDFEESLIHYLSDGPKTIEQITSFLYNDLLNDKKTIEAKTRTLIHRINLKKKGLIGKNKANTFSLLRNKLFDEIIMNSSYSFKI